MKAIEKFRENIRIITHDFVLKGKRKTEIMDGLLMAIQKVEEADIEKDVKEIILTTLKAECFDGENNKW